MTIDSTSDRVTGDADDSRVRETAEEPTANHRRQGRSVRVGFVLLVVINCFLIGLIAIGVNSPGDPQPVVEAEETVEVERVTPAQASVPPILHQDPVRSVVRALTPPAWYRSVGDLEDIFCFPGDGETERAWRSRVPSYCLAI